MRFIEGIANYGFKDKVLCIDDEGNATIKNKNLIAADKSNIIEAEQQYALLPGWFDTHIHGNSGFDFADNQLDEKALATISKKLAEAGLAYCLPTFVSLKLTDLKKNLAILDNFIVNQKKLQGAAQFLGVHLEGPFIAKNCKGAHDINVLQESVDINMLIDLIRSAPHINFWKITLAPELNGAIQFIKDCQYLVVDGCEKNIKIFIGHTNADPQFLAEAIKAGACGFTHLGNANCEEAHRAKSTIHHEDLKSNVVKFALDEKNINLPAYFELIADSHHLSKEFVNFALMRREKKAILITDALGPTGLSDGIYQLGSLAIEKKGDIFTLARQEKLAGSAASFATIVKKFSEMTAKEGEALWQMLYDATVVNPRKTVLPDNIELNDTENFVILDRTGKLMLSVCNGQTYYHSPELKDLIENKEAYRPSLSC